VRRPLAAAAVLALCAAALYFFLIRDAVVAPRVNAPVATAMLGSGESAIAVTDSGAVVPWLPLPAEPELPQLPLSEPPEGGRLAGPMLQQARVLGAAPPALRPSLASSYYGESGVSVETASGIELRFGDASQAARKWKAAAAVLADPEITALDYVDLQAPPRATIGGSGHALPPLP
jgi:Cell division protein FtsQ